MKINNFAPCESQSQCIFQWITSRLSPLMQYNMTLTNHFTIQNRKRSLIRLFFEKCTNCFHFLWLNICSPYAWLNKKNIYFECISKASVKWSTLKSKIADNPEYHSLRTIGHYQHIYKTGLFTSNYWTPKVLQFLIQLSYINLWGSFWVNLLLFAALVPTSLRCVTSWLFILIPASNVDELMYIWL